MHALFAVYILFVLWFLKTMIHIAYVDDFGVPSFAFVALGKINIC
jgi:hypothetical protein